jgi:hypothetical protein
MVYDVNTITDGENAVNVIGFDGFETGNAGTSTSQTLIQAPAGLAYDTGNKRLYAQSKTAHKIHMYDVEPAPVVVGMTSSTASGVKNTGSVISIQVQFSVNVTVTGTPTLTLETGTTDAVANYTS